LSFFEPTHCRLDAFTLLADQLPDLHTTDGLVRAAVAVSMHELDEAGLMGVETTLDDLAEQVQGRVMRADPRALVAHAHEVLFEEARFRGNQGDYEDPANSYLPRVLRTRLGLPITLALVYKAVLDRLGVPVFGINAPGHDLAALRGAAVGDINEPDKMVIIDTFAGGRLRSREEALDRVIEATGGNLLLNEAIDFLAVASHKQWLMRIIRNLHLSFQRRGQTDDAAAMAEMIRLVETQG